MKLGALLVLSTPAAAPLTFGPRIQVGTVTPEDGLLAPVVIGTGATGTTVAAILMDDMDGDSLLDLAVANADRNVRLHRGLPGGMLGSPEVLLFGNNRFSALAAADVDLSAEYRARFVCQSGTGDPGAVGARVPRS